MRRQRLVPFLELTVGEAGSSLAEVRTCMHSHKVLGPVFSCGFRPWTSGSALQRM